MIENINKIKNVIGSKIIGVHYTNYGDLKIVTNNGSYINAYIIDGNFLLEINGREINESKELSITVEKEW